MSTPTEIAQQQAEAVRSAVLKSVEGFQKLAAINLEHSRAALDTAAEQWKQLLGAKDIKGVAELAQAWVKPSAEAVVSYAKAVQAATAQTSTELVEQARAQLDKTVSAMVTQLEALMKNAPAGSDGVVSLVKEAITVANTTFDQVSAAGKKLVDAGMASAQAAAASAAPKKN